MHAHIPCPVTDSVSVGESFKLRTNCWTYCGLENVDVLAGDAKSTQAALLDSGRQIGGTAILRIGVLLEGSGQDAKLLVSHYRPREDKRVSLAHDEEAEKDLDQRR